MGAELSGALKRDPRTAFKRWSFSVPEVSRAPNRPLLLNILYYTTSGNIKVDYSVPSLPGMRTPKGGPGTFTGLADCNHRNSNHQESVVYIYIYIYIPTYLVPRLMISHTEVCGLLLGGLAATGHTASCQNGASEHLWRNGRTP